MYYLDCISGVSGDMLLATFLDQHDVEVPKVLGMLEKAGGVMAPTKVTTAIKDVLGTKARVLSVEFTTHGHHIDGLELKRHLENACNVIGLGPGKKFALDCIDDLLHAECRVHNEALDRIHLHETGTPDTLVDLCGMGYFYERMGLDREGVWATPISVGGGSVRISHGLVEVPAPATRLLLEGLRFMGGPVQAELATPTGVAIIRNLVKGFVDTIPDGSKVLGQATGSKRFEMEHFVNVLRLHRGEWNG